MKFARLLMVLAFIGHCLVDPPGLFGQMVNGPPVQHGGIPLELPDSILIETNPPTIEPTPPALKDTPPPAPIEVMPSPVRRPPVQLPPVVAPQPTPVAQAPSPTNQQPIQQPPDQSPTPPDALLEGPPSARLGEMVVMRAFRPTNVEYCEWTVEPEPSSVEIVDITEGRGRAKRVTGPGQELHWSSTGVGVFVVMMSISGPGGLKNVKRRVAYGTLVDDNVLAPAAENMAMDEQPGNLQTGLIHAIRSVRSSKKTAEAGQLADAFDKVAHEIAHGNINNPSEMTLAIKRVSINALGANWAKWVGVLQMFSQGMSDSAESGVIDGGLVGNTFTAKGRDDHRQACEAAAELLRGEQ